MSLSIIDSLQELEYRLQKVVHPLKRVAIELTKRCNLRCLHCYASAARETVSEIDLKQIRELADELVSDFRAGLHIALTGGEPLLHQDVLEIIDCFKNKNFTVSLSTNGLLVNEELAVELAKRLSGISVSIDGLQESHDFLRQAPVFERAVCAISALKEAGVRHLTVKTALYCKNRGEISRLYSLMNELGINQWHLFPVEPKGRAAEHRDLLLSQAEYDLAKKEVLALAEQAPISIVFGEEAVDPKASRAAAGKKRCHAGITHLAILSDGSLTGCIGRCRGMKDIEGRLGDGNLRQSWDCRFEQFRCKQFRHCGTHCYEEAD